jgi:hydroxymethylglutaryl-CoA lyase
MDEIKIIESPRDAMQGLPVFIPTTDKARYINALLNVGFDTIDFGSFVSPKAIPQLGDTAEVLSQLKLDNCKTNLLAIIANLRGAVTSGEFDQIHYVGYPFSISETFLHKNSNSNFAKSEQTIGDLLNFCNQKNKELVVYISMAFGNPYGDEWNAEIVVKWVYRLYHMGVRIIPLSDTLGLSSKKSIAQLFGLLVPEFPEIEFGLHLHTTIRHWYKRIDAAYTNGCRRFDTVINGLGGCPMAENKLVGNLRTSYLLEYLDTKDIPVSINEEAFDKAYEIALEIFP